ncbi:hypothetical protein HELRODRAFT_71907 [Helobdella robusta]|uniref:Biogenesis of lysosome-related organelles complex 1 subunit 1 n=1 Tax=Helobdella robusta TaxID=6412 RepID=T1G0S9_HELRO|nr:hypothetical protein HELRODRAFT_71907 [Helobdella robusta]ESO10801.1 hypothetical protein HELRODRAFT_71907 [Helobdella robusta]
MLSSMVKEHQAKQAQNRELQEKRRLEATVATTKFANALVDSLNKGVGQAYVNQKKLDTETKILHANVMQLTKQTNLWLKLINDFNQAVKEIGDVENWSRSIEADMRTISSALEYVYKSNKVYFYTRTHTHTHTHRQTDTHSHTQIHIYS